MDSNALTAISLVLWPVFPFESLVKKSNENPSETNKSSNYKDNSKRIHYLISCPSIKFITLHFATPPRAGGE
jgi:hypothetical protein